MRAGRLDRRVVFQRATYSTDDAGVSVATWAEIGSLRCEIMERTVGETAMGANAVTTADVTIRTRFFPGLTVADRAVIAGEHFNITSIAEIGRRRGLEVGLKGFSE